MYVRFSRRLCRAFVSPSHSRGNRYILTSCQQLVAFNRPSAGNLTRNLYSSNISFRERDTTALYENGMALNVDYKQLLEAQKNVNVLIVDVREPSEIRETGKLPGSIHIPMNDVRNEFVNLSEEEFEKKYGKRKPTKNTKIIFSCRSGRRSGSVQETMQKLGYTQAYNYTGGWLDWEKHTKK